MVLSDTHRAWAWHHSAAVAADETGWSGLGLQVRSLGILIPLYSGDSREALSMTAEACDVMGECKAALHESGESFARLDHAGKTDSIFGFSERR